MTTELTTTNQTPARAPLIMYARQKPLQRSLHALITFAVWALWFYLLLPLLTLLAWFLGIRNALVVLVVRNHGGGLFDMLLVLKIALIAAIVVQAWAAYSMLRFGGKDRRRAHKIVRPAAVAAWFGISDNSAAMMREAQRVVVDLDVDGRLLDARPMPTSSA